MTAALDRFRQQRSSNMNARVERALKDLDTAGAPINISRVASTAGVSRQWLYDSPYRAEIERLRARPSTAREQQRPAREEASTASLRTQLDSLRERLAESRAENAELRAELERALGLLREARS